MKHHSPLTSSLLSCALSVCAAMALAAPVFAQSANTTNPAIPAAVSPTAPAEMAPNKVVRTAPGHPGQSSNMDTPLPTEPTAAGVSPMDRNSTLKEARAQYARDKKECRTNYSTRKEIRACEKSARMQRNEKMKDASPDSSVSQ